MTVCSLDAVATALTARLTRFYRKVDTFIIKNEKSLKQAILPIAHTPFLILSAKVPAWSGAFVLLKRKAGA